MKRIAMGCCVLAMLSGCAGKSPQQVNNGYSLPPKAAARPAALPDAHPAASPGFQGDPSEAVWHLRAGLNVAALTCRGAGRTPVTASYARVLTRHKALLAEAYASEQRRYGKGLDRHQTRLYNQFSNQQDPVKFCARAAAVARQVSTMESPALALGARNLLGQIG